MSTFAKKFENRLNKTLCDFFGITPEPRWICSDDGGKSMSAWTDRINGPWYSLHELQEWLADQQKHGRHQDCKLIDSPVYPFLSTRPEEAVRLLEAMEKTKWRILSSTSRRVGDERPFNRIAWSCELRCCNCIDFDFGDRGGFALGTHHTFAGSISRSVIFTHVPCRRH